MRGGPGVEGETGHGGPGLKLPCPPFASLSHKWAFYIRFHVKKRGSSFLFQL